MRHAPTPFRQVADAIGPFCPRCEDAPIVETRVAGVAARECGRCAGLWLSPDRFAALLLDDRARREVAARAGVAPWVDREVRYLRCPTCDQRMARSNFGRTSGVIVDSCPRHGIWFDRDDLPHVVRFLLAHHAAALSGGQPWHLRGLLHMRVHALATPPRLRAA